MERWYFDLLSVRLKSMNLNIKRTDKSGEVIRVGQTIHNLTSGDKYTVCRDTKYMNGRNMEISGPYLKHLETNEITLVDDYKHYWQCVILIGKRG